jgi:8-oxo-dGTP diphosphatase
MPNIAPESDRLAVVAAVIRDHQGRVLLAQRPSHKHQGGRWEFPGGKVEPGEALDVALARELEEELGVVAQHCRPFMTVDHHYPDLHVRLHFREVMAWGGVPHGREGQTVNWFHIDAMQTLTFPAANRPVVSALTLSDYLLVMPDQLPEDWQARLLAALARGCGLVYLRGLERHPQRLREAVALCRHHGALSLVRDDVMLMKSVGADGLHLSAANAARLNERPAVSLLSVACHDPAELAQAERLQADLVTLSPVQRTASHLEVAPLGWPRFAELATGRPFAVYALGGMSPQDLDAARQHGARGIAAIRAFL